MSIEEAPSMQPPQRLSRRMAETYQLGSAQKASPGPTSPTSSTDVVDNLRWEPP
jgi:hypothetical protein